MFAYRPHFVPTKILIIGCGGTGSRIVPLLAQFIKTCSWVKDPEITLIDDDFVEEKNLLRQNFISVDVGKPKAEVLALRYSRAFNVTINALQARVTDPYKSSILESNDPEIRNAFMRHIANAIIILCVDSPQARRDIIRAMTYCGVGNRGSVLLLDSGNENDFGQVSLSTFSAINEEEIYQLNEMPNAIPGEIIIPGIPMEVDYFEKMVATTTLSCADLDQTMAINTMMAVTMFGIIQNFYYAKLITYNRINISLSHGSIPQYMNTDFIKKSLSYAQKKIDRYTLFRFHVGEVISEFYYKEYLPFKEAMVEAERKRISQESIPAEVKEAPAKSESVPKKKVKKIDYEESLKIIEEGGPPSTLNGSAFAVNLNYVVHPASYIVSSHTV